MEQDQKILLEPTASMALLLGKGVYEGNGLISEYLKKIDLSSGMPLAERMKQSNRWIEEILVNRKYFYHDSIFNHIRTSPHNSQVVILGVGYDPISVHLLEAEADRIINIIEIDMSNFDSKRNIFERIQVPHLEKINFVQADVISDNTLEIIRRYGYDDTKPLVITVEGLMYYLSQEDLIDLIRSFRSEDKSNLFCMDYIFPWEQAPTEEHRMAHKTNLEAVEKQAQKKLAVYSSEKIYRLIESLGGTCIKINLQKNIEFKRTGRNQFFNQEGEGVFEFITFNI